MMAAEAEIGKWEFFGVKTWKDVFVVPRWAPRTDGCTWSYVIYKSVYKWPKNKWVSLGLLIISPRNRWSDMGNPYGNDHEITWC